MPPPNQSNQPSIQKRHTSLLSVDDSSSWRRHLHVGIFAITDVVDITIERPSPPLPDADRRRSKCQYRDSRKGVARPAVLVLELHSIGRISEAVAGTRSAVTALVRASIHISVPVPDAVVLDAEDGPLRAGRLEVGPRCLLHVGVGLKLIALVAV
eukprot:CAMPEP_0184446808 /NCGR_PEP_ID=MMETSP0740-20130409/3219_1 /TAXON_ID=385413 /ORGANISM="Thalassiosira miniscula, Strain CCMP1093" /LENGTH=154 /DNA_ID=CAMNT_0026816255 /DNA_START=116 /DNA_END=576 /DNA_ORIENTATION=-